LIVIAEDHGRCVLFTLDLAVSRVAGRGHLPREICRGGWFGSPEPAGGRIFLNASSLRLPPEVFVCDAGGKGLRRSTGFTKPGLSGIEMSAIEEEVIPGADGNPVQMFLLLPPGVGGSDKTPKRPWPLVHMIHGGPHGAFGDQWHWRWNAQAFAAPGYLVALVNFHGSTGFGADFTASILGRWGDQPFHDIMAATDHLIGRGLADPARMAATGGSYGGYLVSWIASQTDRFAALINHAGVSDFQPQYASDITQGRARSMGGEPWDNVQGMDRYNPLRHAAGFRSPMLVIHGEKDYRVPHCQGIEIYNVYKAMKLPARLVIFPDENHWVLKPRNSIKWYEEVLGWLDRHLGAKAKSGRATPGSRPSGTGKGRRAR
jgi:dipeptidyl aminopeptidase/acylaminoacyl peptidase